MRWIAGLSIAAIGMGISFGKDISVRYHGAGWYQAGRIMDQSDTLSDGQYQNFIGNWMQNAGGQITAVADLGEGWEGGLGLGVIQSHNMRGSFEKEQAVAVSWSPYVTDARLTYTVGEPESPSLQVNVGAFHFNYNPDIKNLGLYLLRGMAYPDIVISGFEMKDMLPIANTYGLNIRHDWGGYRGDFIAHSERDVNPYFDFSLAYLARYKFGSVLEVGAGANWYRALPTRPQVTSPGNPCPQTIPIYRINPDDKELCYILDSTVVQGAAGDSVAGIDTIPVSFQALKLMARASLDIKPLIGIGSPFGPRDLLLYSEVAVLGVKDYPKYYNDITRRMPVMVGFNLPAFGWLDDLSLEVEYFSSRNSTDYQKVVEEVSPVPRPIRHPATDTKSNDWKWSLYGAKVIAGHLKISGQVASDHYRSGGYFLLTTQSETLSKPTDWYWIGKIAYYF